MASWLVNVDGRIVILLIISLSARLGGMLRLSRDRNKGICNLILWQLCKRQPMLSARSKKVILWNLSTVLNQKKRLNTKNLILNE